VKGYLAWVQCENKKCFEAEEIFDLEQDHLEIRQLLFNSREGKIFFFTGYINANLHDT
jgi:hypothetical protein